MDTQPKTDLSALGEPEPSSLVETLRSALGVALVLGLISGLVDGVLALSSVGAGVAWHVLPVGVLLDTVVLVVALLLAGLIFHGALRRAPRSAARRLFAFLGSALVGAGLAFLAGGAPWLEALLVLAGSLFSAWLLGRLGARVTASLRVLALTVAVIGLLVLRGAALDEASEPELSGTTGLLVVVLPGLELGDLRIPGPASELVQGGVLLEQVLPPSSGQPAGLGQLLYPEGVDVLRTMLGTQGATRSVPEALWSELAIPAAAIAPEVRGRSHLSVRRIAHAMRRRAGDAGLVRNGVDWLAQRAGRRSAVVVGLRGSADATERAASLGELHAVLTGDAVGERTLLLLMGAPLPGAESPTPKALPVSVPALFRNTRLVPHGGQLSSPQRSEALLSAASTLLGWELETPLGAALAAEVAIAGPGGSTR